VIRRRDVIALLGGAAAANTGATLIENQEPVRGRAKSK
jgi:hypothetical protein